MCNTPGSNYLIVLFPKSIKLYDVNMLSKPYPSCAHYYKWAGPPAIRGEIMPSPEAGKILVWRWTGEKQKNGKRKVMILPVMGNSS